MDKSPKKSTPKPKILWKEYIPMRDIGFRSALPLLRDNVCELFILRRHPKPGWKRYRRMLCTNNLNLLMSSNGYNILGFKPAISPDPMKRKPYNLITVWDIFMQDYRCVNLDECYLVKTHIANDKFWDTFNKEFYPMSTEEKLIYMDN